jgi:hypothetical protein
LPSPHPSAPHARPASRPIRRVAASELAGFAYCAKSWAYTRTYGDPPSAASRAALASGQASHAEEGLRRAQVEQALSHSRGWWRWALAAGLALAGMLVLSRCAAASALTLVSGSATLRSVGRDSWMFWLREGLIAWALQPLWVRLTTVGLVAVVGAWVGVLCWRWWTRQAGLRAQAREYGLFGGLVLAVGIAGYAAVSAILRAPAAHALTQSLLALLYNQVVIFLLVATLLVRAGIVFGRLLVRWKLAHDPIAAADVRLPRPWRLTRVVDAIIVLCVTWGLARLLYMDITNPYFDAGKTMLGFIPMCLLIALGARYGYLPYYRYRYATDPDYRRECDENRRVRFHKMDFFDPWDLPVSSSSLENPHRPFYEEPF